VSLSSRGRFSFTSALRPAAGFRSPARAPRAVPPSEGKSRDARSLQEASAAGHLFKDLRNLWNHTER
jgi:hypothetical protein